VDPVWDAEGRRRECGAVRESRLSLHKESGHASLESVRVREIRRVAIALEEHSKFVFCQIHRPVRMREVEAPETLTGEEVREVSKAVPAKHGQVGRQDHCGEAVEIAH
jgi:hypothetical protein